ncbi:MAG: hypothetical protein ACPGVU_09180, partial [Limisphaerales bacterium]
AEFVQARSLAFSSFRTRPNPKLTLPRSERVEFKISDDNQWQEISLNLETKKALLGLRLDTGDENGPSIIADLKLRDSGGKVLRSWPR